MFHTMAKDQSHRRILSHDEKTYTRPCLALSTHTPTPPLAMDETPNRDLREGPEDPKMCQKAAKRPIWHALGTSGAAFR